jgi:hypothetical protein
MFFVLCHWRRYASHLAGVVLARLAAAIHCNPTFPSFVMMVMLNGALPRQ